LEPNSQPRCSCIICHKEFSVKGIYTHFERAHGSKEQKSKYSSGHNGLYQDQSYKKSHSDGIRPRFDKQLGPVKDYQVNCKTCDTQFTVRERESKFPSKSQYFCSRSCANTRSHETETKLKIKAKREYQNNICKIRFGVCRDCNKSFLVRRGNRKFCNPQCRKNHARKNKTPKQIYREDCQFKFALNDYPDRFDFNLIEKYGWYSAPNKGNNVTGVSRDHMVSIDYGWKHGIPAEIIAHPANCQLMQHTENWNKRSGCSISIQELYERIEKW
jgi:hypothetical protein